MTERKLEEIDFRPQKVGLMLTLFLLFYGLIFGSVLFLFGIRDLVSGGMSSLTTWLEVVFIVGNYVLVGFFLLFYVVLGAYRFKFGEDGVRVMTWLGPRFYEWKQVQNATLASHRGGIDLILNYGRWQSVTIPLNAFARNRSLYEQISHRLPVRVAAAKRTLAILEDR